MYKAEIPLYQELPMAVLNIKKLDFEGLLALRAQIDTQLSAMRSGLEAQLARLGNGHVGNGKVRRGRSLKGRKVAPKFRSRKDPKLTWAGRGATPVWMRDEMKAGKLKKEAFLIK
jgi:DNA-binding protein H-NS